MPSDRGRRSHPQGSSDRSPPTGSSPRHRVALRPARAGEAARLADISRRSFDSDLEVGAPGPGGPPGYDDPLWQRGMMDTAEYLAIVVDGDLAGGAIVAPRSRPAERELWRIFLDPRWFRRGLGMRAVELVIARYPEARRWILDTPAWNRRTRAFYERLGFAEYGRRIVGDGFELVLFSRDAEPAP